MSSDAAAAAGLVDLHRIDGSEIVVRLSGDSGVLRAAAHGLPEGAALPEAVAARVRRAGGQLEWGEPVPAVTSAELLRLCRARGASSIEIVRADPSLLPELQLGSYFNAGLRARILRRFLLRCSPARLLAQASLSVAADLAFWRGVRTMATTREWRRLTKSSYVVLYYHRIAGEGKPGEQRLDVAPRVFERHMSWLRRLKIHPLAADALIAFHADPEGILPPRSVVLAADDGFRDAVIALGRHLDLRPILFVTTSAVGSTASWADNEPIASWSELRQFTSGGGAIASHAHTHVSLCELNPDALAHELRESSSRLRAHACAAPLLAYPHGLNNEAVRAAAANAGYLAAFTTETGRNGAGADPYCLRRVGPKGWDGPAAFVWKALTGELVPWPLERLRLRLHGVQSVDGA